MCARDLTDIYTLSPRASGAYISQIPRTHGITITYTLGLVSGYATIAHTIIRYQRKS